MNQDLALLDKVLDLISSDKMNEIEAERLFNAYTRTLTKEPTHGSHRERV